MSAAQLVLAVLLVVLGVACYYVAPVSFLFNEYRIFFLILNGLLLMMILGLTFLSVLLQPYIEWLFVATTLFTCCRRDRKMFSLINKNLDAHRVRNIKTAIMFAVCLAFLMFAGSTF